MDEPKSPAEPNKPKSQWPEDSGSEQGFGATGIFGTVKKSDSFEQPAAVQSGVDPGLPSYRLTEAVKTQPAPGPRSLAEPVVHKVVFGGGATDSSQDLLERLRMASAERPQIAEKAPVSEPDPLAGGQGSGGFTQLLRTLGSTSTSPAVGAVKPALPEAPRPAPDSGFTSLLQRLSTPAAAAPSAETPVRMVQSTPQPIPEEPRIVPKTSGSRGFTELFRAMPGEGSGSSQTQAPGQGGAPVAGGFGVAQAPVENKPGGFTQLFGSFGGAEARPPEPLPVERPASAPSGGGAGSFTQLLNLGPQAAPKPAPLQEERRPTAGGLDYGVSPGPAGTGRDPFSAPPAAGTQPVQAARPGGGAGLTELFRRLDAPVKAPPPPPPLEPAPASPSQEGEPGLWTQTFNTLTSTPKEAAVAAPVPELAPPAPAPAPLPPAARDPQPPASFGAPAGNAPPAASGPSEFTRILDASRLREMAMRGGQAAGAASPGPAAPPQGFAPPAAPAPPPMPGYPPPAPPPMAGTPPIAYPPPTTPPAYPVNYAPPPGGMQAPAGSPPPMPGMYPPAPPPMPAPAPPPPKPAQPGVGKLQQLVPVLLVVIIVLLVALLVTVIFLMKH